MRILFATAHPYPPQTRGGTEISTHELCVAMRQEGHDCAVLARLFRHDRFGRGRVVRQLLSGGRAGVEDRHNGYPVYRWRRPHQHIAGLLRRFRPDVAVVQAGLPLPLAEHLDAAGVPTMVYVRDLFAVPEVASRLAALPRLGFLANSAFSAARAGECGLTVAGVVPPLVRPEAYRTTTSRERVLFVNPQPGKGADIAFALAEARPDIAFDFLQSWNLEPQWAREAAARAAQLPNIAWLEPRGDIRPVLARARLVLAPSRWTEGWGRIVSEAQVSAIPALASSRGGLPEAVGPGGILLDPDEGIEAWSEALGWLWDDPGTYDRAVRAAAAHAARPAFQPQALAGQLTRLLGAHIARASAMGPSGNVASETLE